MSDSEARSSIDQSIIPRLGEVSSITVQRNPPPLVIVSQQGRHSQASRRIVRAQAARASAAQSRVTRARNREGREGGSSREIAAAITTPPSNFVANNHHDSAKPITSPRQQRQHSHHYSQPHYQHQPSAVGVSEFGGASGPLSGGYNTGVVQPEDEQQQPLVRWLTSLLRIPAQTLQLYSSATAADVADSSLRSLGRGLRLPIALPRGFVSLSQRIDVSPDTLALLSRTSCIDFASPGVEQRLHKLLFDLAGILTTTSGLPGLAYKGHPIQDYLLVACTCLTIFQGQRADGQSFAGDQAYQKGLEAAGLQATLLNMAALTEPKSAEASVWAIFIISVCTGVTDSYFHDTLQNLLDDLQLSSWDQVRRVLLDFIYPVSFMDELCKRYYSDLPFLAHAVR